MYRMLRSGRALGALLAGLAILPISAFAGGDTLDAQATVEAHERASPLDDCRVSKVAGPSAVKILETDFDVRLRDRAIIEGKCAPFARSHIMGHVYFAGGAAASIADDGTLLSRPSDKSVTKASETVCDGRNHALTYATLVAPLKLIERKDAKYVGVFREEGKWTIAAFETDVDGRIVKMKRFLVSEHEVVGLGYFPHPHLNAGQLGLTIKRGDGSATELLTYDWTHQNFSG